MEAQWSHGYCAHLQIIEVVWVQALARVIVSCSLARHSLWQCLSLPRFIKGYQQNLCWGAGAGVTLR